MGKLGPKLQLSFLNSIQICRPKDISSLVKNPVPHYSTLNSHTHSDMILFPSFQDPSPPPPPPHHGRPKSRIIHAHDATTSSKSRQQHPHDKTITKEPKLKAKVATTELDGERQRGVRTRRFKRFGSKEWKDGSQVVENETRVDHSKVDESFVVMKRSVDPCQDFKRSMLEMIVEKHLFEPIELENLLMTFLSLNSETHHRAILKAFTEIWKGVFSAGSSN